MGNEKINAIGVLTSGGDAPGMNAAIRAVVRACVHYNIKCIGIKQGYKGLLDKEFINLDARSVSNIIDRGGSFLRSARCKEFADPATRQRAYQNAKEAGIDALVVIGGDGSFTGALKLSNETGLPVIGVPGTIDNDIYGTDYSIGFDTAINTAMDALDKIRDTAAAHDRIFFVEVMGHGSGFISVYTGIAAGVENIVMPPKKDKGKNIIPDGEDLYDEIADSLRNKKTGSSIVIVSENGHTIGERVHQIVKEVSKRLPEKDIKETVLGHIQRGGSPSCADRVLASRLGVAAVEGLIEGKNRVVAGVRDGKITYSSLKDNTLYQDLEKDPEVKRVNDIIGEFKRVSDITNA